MAILGVCLRLRCRDPLRSFPRQNCHLRPEGVSGQQSNLKRVQGLGRKTLGYQTGGSYSDPTLPFPETLEPTLVSISGRVEGS